MVPTTSQAVWSGNGCHHVPTLVLDPVPSPGDLDRFAVYRFAHIDGRIGSNSAQYVRWPKVHPS
jgi:hypothetical protein